VQTIGRALVAQGFKVSVVGIGTEDSQTLDEGVAVYTVSRNKLPKIGAFLSAIKLNRCIKQIHQANAIDVVESNEAGLALLKKTKGIQYIIRMHGGHHFFTKYENRALEKSKAFLEKKSFSKADAILAVSDFVGEETKKMLGLKLPITTIYNPIHTKNFPEAKPDTVVSNRLLFVGTVCEKKGIRQLVQAFPKVKERFPDATLQIVGRDWRFPDGRSYIDYLKTYIRTEDTEVITIVGPVAHTEIPKYISEAAVCVYPSHMEAMPLAWLEVLSMGKPFVASAIGPGFEAVKDGETGLLCNPHQPEDIAEKVIWMLQHPVEAQQMGKNARKDILQRFDVEVILKQNIDFYKNIVV
jgi:glycosyltransferase involved in cell wall biosynthesis